MIQKLVIDNFKSIEHVEVSCANLNLFVGTNSSGKSTILQALLLLAQHTSFSQGLSGELVSLGSYDDSKCKYSGKKNIVKLFGDAILSFVSVGADRTMNAYNGK